MHHSCDALWTGEERTTSNQLAILAQFKIIILQGISSIHNPSSIQVSLKEIIMKWIQQLKLSIKENYLDWYINEDVRDRADVIHIFTSLQQSTNATEPQSNPSPAIHVQAREKPQKAIQLLRRLNTSHAMRCAGCFGSTSALRPSSSTFVHSKYVAVWLSPFHANPKSARFLKKLLLSHQCSCKQCTRSNRSSMVAAESSIHESQKG